MNRECAKQILLGVGGVLDRHEVPFFFILGTCLGFHREGDFIKHDKDIDLGVLAEDLLPKVDALAKDFRGIGYKVRIISDARLRSLAHSLVIGWPRYYLRVTSGKECVDIVGLLKGGQDRYWPSLKNISERACVVYPAHLVEDVEEVEYFGRAWKTPKAAYLDYHYGPGWRTPDPEWKPERGPARVKGYRVAVSR